jgi:hypothetical protein
MDAKPKRRWYQFSLRALLVLITLCALSLCWWNHRSFCLRRAEELSTVSLDAEMKYDDAVHQILFQQRMASEYRRAVRQPWLRLWIDDKRSP